MSNHEKEAPHQPGGQVDKTQKPSVISIITSTCAAAFGVQSSKNQQKDFTKGNIITFIVAGVIFTAVFVVVVASLVNWVISSQT